METSKRNIRGFIFDLDGTLVNNIAFHQKSWIELFRRYEWHVDVDEFMRATNGRHGREIIRDYFGVDTGDPENQRLNDEKESLYRELYAPHRCPSAGLVELMDRADAAGIEMAVGTSAPPENVAFILDHLGIRQRFRAVVGTKDVVRGKPDPEVFLVAAARMNVDPGQCLVFEDALIGVEAARRAGMPCVALTTSLVASAFSAVPHVVASAATFAELEFEALLSARFPCLETVLMP